MSRLYIEELALTNAARVDQNLWRGSAYGGTSMRTASSARYLQSQGPLAVPNNVARLIPVLSGDGSAPSTVPVSNPEPHTTDRHNHARAAGQVPRVQQGQVNQECRPAAEPQDRVGAADGDSGEYCPPAYDWQLCWETTRYASPGQRPEYPEQRKDSQETQQAGPVLGFLDAFIVLCLIMVCFVTSHCLTNGHHHETVQEYRRGALEGPTRENRRDSPWKRAVSLNPPECRAVCADLWCTCGPADPRLRGLRRSQ